MRIDWEALLDAFSFDGEGRAAFLDRTTGQLLVCHDPEQGGDPADIARVEAEPERWLFVERPSAKRQWVWMEEFTKTVESKPLARMLGLALDGGYALVNFPRALASDAAELERWREYRAAHLRWALADWVESQSLDVENGPPWAA